jgi:SpoVK/Ycf46/Vps4 family AAA+-type ATPase
VHACGFADENPLSGGVLLSGPPGTGKTLLAKVAFAPYSDFRKNAKKTLIIPSTQKNHFHCYQSQ